VLRSTSKPVCKKFYEMLAVSAQFTNATDRQTDTHTHRQTDRLADVTELTQHVPRFDNFIKN